MKDKFLLTVTAIAFVLMFGGMFVSITIGLAVAYTVAYLRTPK